MTLYTLIFRYSVFAVVATMANLATQRVVLQFGDSDLFFAVAVGTGTVAGLVIKYLLDKRWIYYAVVVGVKNHSQTFTLYTAMGVITTAIFWGTETVFWLIWHTDTMREVGAILGLSIGYIVKYQLDRRFVFTDRQLQVAS